MGHCLIKPEKQPGKWNQAGDRAWLWGVPGSFAGALFFTLSGIIGIIGIRGGQLYAGPHGTDQIIQLGA